MDDFDPYLTWLDIGRREHPISDRRLLGLRDDQSDPQVIAAAADRVLTHLLQFSSGAQAEHCRRLTAEVAAARDRLLAASGAAGAAPTPRRTEWQIKPPPPVPSASATSQQPEPRRAPPAFGAAAPTSPGAPQIVSHGLPVRPAPPANADNAPAVTPVGMLLGQMVSMSPPAAAALPAAAPTVEGRAVSSEGARIPAQRSSQVGKSNVAAADQGQTQPELTTAGRVRRDSRKQQSYVWATLVVGGVCLVLLLIVLLIVARNS